MIKQILAGAAGAMLMVAVQASASLQESYLLSGGAGAIAIDQAGHGKLYLKGNGKESVFLGSDRLVFSDQRGQIRMIIDPVVQRIVFYDAAGKPARVLQ